MNFRRTLSWRKLNWSRIYRCVLRFSVLSLFFLVQSCDEDPSPKGKYEGGATIVNEGGFGSANGTLTFFDMASGRVEQNIFRNEGGDFAGDVVQSITFSEDKGYVVINGDNKVEIVNGNTFEHLETIESSDLDKPRYVEVIDNKAYISVWGPYEEGGFSLIDSYVLVVDLNTNTVIKKIETDEGTENLLFGEKYLFASNYNFGASNSVAVIDPTTNSLVKHIELASGPAGSVLDSNGKLWVICTGDFGASNGKLFRIHPETLEVEESIELNVNPDVDLGITPDKSELIYSVGSSIYSISISATVAPEDKLFEAEDVVYNYAMGVDPDSGNIWIADALNFATEGKVYVYTNSGVPVTGFKAGISPTQVVFK
jgi:DNA-binding beta-propeller fold protein YncE